MTDRLMHTVGAIGLEAFPTGRKEERGMLKIEIDTDECYACHTLSTVAARSIGEKLIEFANAADKFSTRGFKGSDE